MSNTLEAARERVTNAEKALRSAADNITNAPQDTPSEVVENLHRQFDEAEAAHRSAKEDAERMKRVMEARSSSPRLLDTEDGRRSDGADAVYRRGGEHSFFSDLYRSRHGDRDAQKRLDYHADSVAEQRDLDSGSGHGSGFVPPIWLASEWADLERAGRQFADIFPTLPLPSVGLSISVPKVTGGASADVQAAELDAVSETDPTTSTVSSDVISIAGQVDVSRQVLERTAPGLDMVIFADLVRAYNSKLDSQLLAGSGSSGQHLGVRNVSSVQTVDFTGSDQASFLSAIYEAIDKVSSNRYELPSHIVMHPRRAAWLSAGRASTFPLLAQGGPIYAVGQQVDGQASTIAGLKVVVDANVGTTYGASTDEDEVYLVTKSDLVLMEDPLRQVQYEDVLSGTLAVRLQVFSFSAAVTSRYPDGICVISGTGLGAPTFS